MIPRLLIGVVVSAALLFLLFQSLDPADFLSSLRRANYWLLIPAIAIYFVGTWVRAARWQILLRPVAHVPVSRLFRATIVGFTVNDLMPVRIGELARAFLLARWDRVPSAATLGTIVVERLFDGLALCGILGLVWVTRPFGGWLGGVALIATAGFGLAAIGAMAAALRPAFCLTMIQIMARPIPDRFRGRLLRLFETFLDGFSVLRRGHSMAPIILLSAIAWSTEAGTYYFLMQAFSIDAGWLAAMLGMVAANLGTMVPSLPGFVGTFHVPLRAVLTDVFQVDRELATSYTLVVHATLIVPVVLLGLYLLWREGLSIADVSKRGSSMGGAARAVDPATRTL